MAETLGTVFVDTSAWYALAVEKDAMAARARRQLDRLEREGSRLATSEIVFTESMALIENRTGRREAEAFGEIVRENPLVEIHFSDRALADEAWRSYKRGVPRASLVDHHSFAFIKRLGLTRVFAFDGDFRKAGFEVMP